ncbi:MAG: hypothetical protein C0602_12355 [Denitrovibrio sp.]|nr:MAG: hypothetical protein C0602_12355 [Denitrovibrio sp.]
MTDINSMYDSNAEDYDGLIRKLVPGYDFFMTISPVLAGNPKTLLDVGCGTGNTAAALRRLHKDAEITCVDSSEKMLNIAKTKVDAKFIQSRSEDFTPETTYDCITSIMALQNIQTRPERENVYKTIYNSLNSPGVYITADMVKGENETTESLYMHMWRQYMLANIPADDVDNQWIPLHKEKDVTYKISEQMVMLYDAGFRSIDIINKNINFVIMACYK